MGKRTKFGKWRVQRPLGRGGQSEVHIVTDSTEEERSPCVLKELTNPHKRKVRQRFQRELDAYLRLSHPNILQVVDADLDHRPPYIVFPHCAGGTLTQLDHSGFTLSERLQLFSAICEGVGFAHLNAVVHRDLKPNNILIQSDGTPVVADFGIAFIDESGHRFTFTEEVVGPRWYTAPELEAGRLEEINASSDVFSLGKVLYWMLSSRIFPRERHHDREYDLTEEGTSKELALVYERILDRTITLEPGDRFPDANVLRAEVEDVLLLLEARSRFYALSRFEPGNQRQGTYLASFRRGGIVSWEPINVGGDTMLHGFASSSETLAFWAVQTNNETSHLALLFGRALNTLKRERLPVSGFVGRTTHPSHRRFRNLTFDQGGRPAVAFTEGDLTEGTPNRGYELSAFMFDPQDGKYSRRLIADDVGRSMGGEFAVSSDGILAVYHPSDKGGVQNPGIAPETIVATRNGVEREPAGYGETWASPIAFDEKGTLHRAIVRQVPGSPGHRELHHVLRTADGQWSTEVIATGRQLSASIAMIIRSKSVPTIVSQAPDQDGAIAVFERGADGWTNQIHELSAVADTLQVERVRTDAILDCNIDPNGDMHIVLRVDLPSHLSSPTMTGGVCYIQFSRTLELTRHRVLPAASFLGFGIGSGDVVHLCLNLS